jgi:hypothetical protein
MRIVIVWRLALLYEPASAVRECRVQDAGPGPDHSDTGIKHPRRARAALVLWYLQ